jgi:uncharacterized repeat protein (TIGR01451 family)
MIKAAVEGTARRLRLLAVLSFLATLAVSAATASGATAASGCGDPTARICVQVVGSSDTVSPSVVTPNFVSYTVLITNQGKSNATHVTLTDTVAVGTFVSANPSAGTCSPAPGGTRCAFGSLASGAQVKVTVLAQAPAQLPAPPDGITNTATVSIDEGVNDSPTPDPKQDTFTASATTVAAPAGTAASLVPTNTTVDIDTDPTFADKTTPANPNIGRAKVPASAHDPLVASLDEVSGSVPPCPKKEICRAGAWLHADIGGGQAFSPALEFTLHWNKSLVPKQQSTKNLHVLKTECLTGCPVVVISRLCSAKAPPTPRNPCLTNIAEDANEFRATVLSSENGYMR